MVSETTDVMVVGAGIQGLAIAAELALVGTLRVLVVDRGPAGGGTTLVGTGGVRTHFSDPLNVRLSLRMLEILPDWAERFGIDPDFRRNGYLYMATEPAHVAAREKVRESANAAGAAIRRVSAAEVRAIVPGMSTDGVIGAWHTETDGLLGVRSAFDGIRRTAERAGVVVRELVETRLWLENDAVRGVYAGAEAISAGTVIVACGLDSVGVLEPTGYPIPLLPEFGQVLHAAPLPALPRWTPLVLDMGTGGYFASRREGFIIGGPDRAGDVAFAPGDIDRLIGQLAHRIPGLTAGVVRGGIAGTRTRSPDDRGIAGLVPGHDNLYVAAGFGHHGFMHAVPSAELVAGLILHGEMPDDLAAMRPDRFGADLGFSGGGH